MSVDTSGKVEDGKGDDDSNNGVVVDNNNNNGRTKFSDPLEKGTGRPEKGPSLLWWKARLPARKL